MEVVRLVKCGEILTACAQVCFCILKGTQSKFKVLFGKWNQKINLKKDVTGEQKCEFMVEKY